MNLLESKIGQKQPELALKIKLIREYIEKYHNSGKEICDPPYMVIDDITAMQIFKQIPGEMFSIYMRELRDANILCDFKRIKGFIEDCEMWRLSKDGSVDNENFEVTTTMFKVKEISDDILRQEEMCNIQWMYYMKVVIDKYNKECKEIEEDIKNGNLPF